MAYDDLLVYAQFQLCQVLGRHHGADLAMIEAKMVGKRVPTKKATQGGSKAPEGLDNALRRILAAPPQHKTAPKKEAARPKRK
jgi:hypothetical protein